MLMFKAKVYKERRKKLFSAMETGQVLLMGNKYTPMNYQENVYPFRQDSSFLYYIGINLPDLAALVNIDSGKVTLFGDEQSMDDKIWMGSRPPLLEWAKIGGIDSIRPYCELEKCFPKDKKEIHYLPPYRSDIQIELGVLLDVSRVEVSQNFSEKLIYKIATQRSVKSSEEINEIKSALDVSAAMHKAAMIMTHPGRSEIIVAGQMEGIVLSHGCQLAYPIIFTTRGEVLHNHPKNITMRDGDLVLNDAGASSPLGYASDITRTFPVNGKFSSRQKDIYELVFDMQEAAFELCKPEIPYVDAHLAAAKVGVRGLKKLGLMKGDADEAVAAGAYALFFPHGIGHMLGLDVHDMESFGEDFIGYDKKYTRSPQFGLRNLRLSKPLKEGYVITVEPGLYFIPRLMDLWKKEKKHSEFICYDLIEEYRSFGGIRIEDNVLITDTGYSVLGQPIPKTISDIEKIMDTSHA